MYPARLHPAALDGFERALQRARSAPTATLADAWTQLELLASSAVDAAAELAAAPGWTREGEACMWMEALVRQCTDHRDDLLHLAPWLPLRLHARPCSP
jgi:hypothetical protein